MACEVSWLGIAGELRNLYLSRMSIDSAYRPTLFKCWWEQGKTALTFLNYLKEFLTLPLTIFLKITGSKVGCFASDTDWMTQREVARVAMLIASITMAGRVPLRLSFTRR